MLPLFGQPAVHCSVTGIRSRLFPGRSRPFQFCWYVAEARLEQQPVRHRRRPPDLFQTAVVAVQPADRAGFRRARRRAGDAADLRPDR